MTRIHYSFNITCPHPECRRAICLQSDYNYIIRFPSDEVGLTYAARICSAFCPACAKLITIKTEGFLAEDESGSDFNQTATTHVVDPPELPRILADPEIPEHVRKEFNEAAAVLSGSPKASAALSRRLLQQVLRDRLKVNPQDLSKEIAEFLTRPGVPTELREVVDAIRHFGNFAAHPNKDKATGDICDVEFAEADWSLDVLESLLDFAYVHPARLATKKASLNKKLQGAGKPPLKS